MSENNKYCFLKGNAKEANTHVYAYMTMLDANVLATNTCVQGFHSKSHY